MRPELPSVALRGRDEQLGLGLVNRSGIPAAPNQPGPNQPGPNQPGPNQPGPYQPGPYQPGPYQPGTAPPPPGGYSYPQGQWGPYGTPYQPVFAPPRPANGVAVASLVLGITSIVFSWWGLLTLLQVVLAVVFGAVGISKANRGASNRGLAIAGLILGLIGLVIYFFIGLFSLGIGWII